MKIYQSRYGEYYYYAEQDLFVTVCFSTTSEMNDQDYKTEQLYYLDLLRKYRAKRLLLNALDFRYPITPSLQEWNFENIAKVEAEMGLRKQAVVVSRDFISQISIEQTIEEEHGAIQTGYFEDVESAKKWLLEK